MSAVCIRCALDDEVHPWHDDGTENLADSWRWYEGGPNAAPRHPETEDDIAEEGRL